MDTGSSRPAKGTALLAAAVLAPVLALGLAGCSEDRVAPDGAVEDLAQALTSGKLTEVAFHGAGATDVQKQWEAVTQGMGATPKVKVGKVSEEGDKGATATLSYAWDLPAVNEHWTYDAKVDLTYRGEAWAVKWLPKVIAPDLRDGETLDVRTTPAKRAPIDGAGGMHIVTERPVVRFGIDKTQVPAPQAAASARALAALVGIDVPGYVARVQGAGPKAFVEAIVLRQAEVPPAVATGYPRIKGTVALEDEMPLAPTKDFARPLLGTVGEVTAEMIEKSEGRLVAGQTAGVSGLQARYDAQLGGTSGVEVLALPAEPAEPGENAEGEDTEGEQEAAEPRVLFEVEPVDGTPLETTLDLELQTLAEQLLAGVRPASALVAVRPSTGEVLAAASGPGGKGYSNATVGQYAPGSTFKVVTSLALLRAGLTESSPVPCPPTTTVEGKGFKNYDDYPPSGLGRITLSTAVANSCNTAFISQRGKLAEGALAEAAASLGLGVDHDLGFPVFLGSVPSDMTGTDLAASAIGQGRVLASPFAMAAVAASVSRGEVVVPQLLPGLEQPDASPAKPLTAQEAASLQRLMRGVVTSGSGRFLTDVPGPPVLAKTGTAEFGTKVPLQTHGWMIAVRGDLAVAVFVEVAESGSATAGPILEGFLRGAR